MGHWCAYHFGDISLPAITQLGPYFFEVGVSHIIDPEDVDVWVFRYAFLDIGEKPERQLFSFLFGRRGVDNFGPF